MANERDHVGFLDGLRGLAALWVFVGHAMILTGARVRLVANPDLGVDLFILISGFLMVHQYRRRQDREPWEEPATWMRFWLRRLFRIAPLYYAVLAAALLLGPSLGASRDLIAAAVPGTEVTPWRYNDQSAANILAHVTFVFGLLPDYHYRTALPDWSIGLEMQYYAAFPFLMLVVLFTGWVRGLLAITVAGVAAAAAVSAAGIHFHQPALLALKLHVFAAGMMIASAVGMGRRRQWVHGALACLLVAIPVGGDQGVARTLVRVVIAAMLFALANRDMAPALLRRVLNPLSRLLSAPRAARLGEVSYGIYLIHLLVMLPVAGLAAAMLPDAAPVLRLALVLAVCVPCTGVLAQAAHRWLEAPGISLGRRVVSRLPSRLQRPGRAA